MLGHIPSSGRNPRGSPDFSAYPVPNACMHVLGTGVPRRLGVARSASSPKAALALGCSSLAGSPAWHRLPQCPGYGHWVSYCCVACVFGSGLCLGSGVGCAPPLLAGVLGCVCACVCTPLVPRHSWLGCAMWACVLELGFRLRPATPGWGVGVFVCLCACSACTPPLLAGMCCVGVCASARVSAAPRHSWLGCWGVCACVRAPLVPRHSWLGCAPWVCVLGLGFRPRPASPGWGIGVCVFVCSLRLYPATPGWGARCGWVRLGSGFSCAPPLLAGVLGCACARSACTPPLLAGACGVGVCALVRGSAAPLPPLLGCWGVCALVCALRLYPATPGWGVRCRCACVGSGFGCAPPLLAGVLGCACLCARSACAPPLLAGVCAVDVCAWARVLAAPRHFRLGCWDVSVFVCALRWCRATAGLVARCGWVCLGSCFGRAPPLLAGVLGCACVRASLVPRHFWLRCAVWACVLGLGFWLRPTTPGWGVGLCVCLCARSACSLPLLAGVRGVGACTWAWVSAVPRHSWLGCRGVCVLVCALRLYPATPGWGVRCRCVCLGLGFGCAPPLLAGVSGCVCACVRTPLVPRHSWLGCAVWVSVLGLGFPLPPATPGRGVGACVRLRVRSSCTPPLLAGVFGVGLCAWARVSAAPRHSWLGCRGVCVLVCGLRLYAATPGWGVVCGCVCLGSGFGGVPPLLAGVLGRVCVCVRARLVPRHSWLGCVVWVCVLGLKFRLPPATPGWGVGVCVLVCALRLYPASPGLGLWCVGLVLPGTCSCAVVRCVLCALPGFAAPGGRCCLAPVRVPWLWPAVCLSGVPGGPALVRRASSGPVALGAPVGFPDAVVPFPTPGACAPGFTGWLRGVLEGR